jgi:O6-methylguanine-DNA--protein-cysteine methyltransferase
MKHLKDARWRVLKDWIDNPVIYTHKEMKKIVKPALVTKESDVKAKKRRWNIIMNLEIGQTWTYINMSGKTTYTRID